MNAPILKAALKPRGKDERKLSMKAVREAQNGLDDTFENVKGDRNGLIARDAIERLAKDGPNEVAQEQIGRAHV